MADAAALTEQHRRAQATIRAAALRDYTRLWPIWTGDEQSFVQLVAASLTLVRAYRGLSANVAAGYYDRLRRVERAAGDFAAKADTVVPDNRVVTSMYVTGRDGLRDALQAGQSATEARETTFVRTGGTLARHIADGGRDTLLDAVAADREALGWARVTDGDPCYFCLTLASRGAVYKTERSANFEAHDHCGCTVMPVFSKAAAIPNVDRWRDIYDRAQQAAVEDGSLSPGENSSKARLNAVRRLLAAEKA